MDKSPLLQRLAETLVTSAVLYLLGVLSAKAPALAKLVQSLIDAAGGNAVVVTGIAGFILALLFALWRRMVSYWKLHVATRLPTGSATPQDVDLVYKQASYGDVLKMRVPSPASARSMLASAKKP